MERESELKPVAWRVSITGKHWGFRKVKPGAGWRFIEPLYAHPAPRPSVSPDIEGLVERLNNLGATVASAMHGSATAGGRGSFLLQDSAAAELWGSLAEDILADLTPEFAGALTLLSEISTRQSAEVERLTRERDEALAALDRKTLKTAQDQISVGEALEAERAAAIARADHLSGEVERLRKAAAEAVEKYDAEGRDLRHDDATRRGYMFAARLIRSLLVNPSSQGAGGC